MLRDEIIEIWMYNSNHYEGDDDKSNKNDNYHNCDHNNDHKIDDDNDDNMIDKKLVMMTMIRIRGMR